MVWYYAGIRQLFDHLNCVTCILIKNVNWIYVKSKCQESLYLIRLTMPKYLIVTLQLLSKLNFVDEFIT